MEFDDLVKIWSVQNKEPLYAINQEALHRRIQAKGRSARRVAGFNEVGLMIIAALTGGYLLVDAIRGHEGFYSYLVALTVLLIGVYVFVGRMRRTSMENRFDRSMLGELDHAIANADYLVSFAKTFVWWFLIPTAIVIVLSMIQTTAPPWKWALISICFPLSYFVVWIELKKTHLPRKRNLEGLREKLRSEQA